MKAREKLDEFAEMTGMNKNQLIGWSIAADFAEWYAEQVNNLPISIVKDRLNDFLSKQQDIPEEIQKVINEKFWDLI